MLLWATDIIAILGMIVMKQDETLQWNEVSESGFNKL